MLEIGNQISPQVMAAKQGDPDMIIGKRTASVITALIGLAILSLPVAAEVGDTDANAPQQNRIVHIVEDNFDSSATYSMTVALFGNTDSDAPAPDRMVHIVEDNLSPSLTTVMSVPGRGEIGSGTAFQNASDATQDRIVQIVEDNFDPSVTSSVLVSIGSGLAQQDASERYVYIVEDASNADETTAVVNPHSSDAVYALLRQPNNVEDVA